MDSGRGGSGVISSLLRYVLHSALTFVGGVLPQTPPEVIRRQQVSGGVVEAFKLGLRKEKAYLTISTSKMLSNLIL